MRRLFEGHVTYFKRDVFSDKPWQEHKGLLATLQAKHKSGQGDKSDFSTQTDYPFRGQNCEPQDCGSYPLFPGYLLLDHCLRPDAPVQSLCPKGITSIGGNTEVLAHQEQVCHGGWPQRGHWLSPPSWEGHLTSESQILHGLNRAPQNSITPPRSSAAQIPYTFKFLSKHF